MGRVMTFDEESKFIGDRLGDACALIFLASEDYNTEDPGRTIIEKEIKLVKERKEKRDDPLAVFAVDLGNDRLMEDLKTIEDIKIKKEDKLPCIFQDPTIQDIYKCREWCLKNLPAK